MKKCFALIIAVFFMVLSSNCVFAAGGAIGGGGHDFVKIYTEQKKVEFLTPLYINAQGYSDKGIDKVEVIANTPGFSPFWATIFGYGQKSINGSVRFVISPGDYIFYANMYSNGATLKSKEIKVTVLSPKPDSPTTGSISTRHLTVSVGEDIEIIAKAEDKDGLVGVWVWYSGRTPAIWRAYSSNKITDRFMFTIEIPGTYTFRGAVMGLGPNGTDPRYIFYTNLVTVTVLNKNQHKH